MNQTSSSAISTNTLHCALELSKNSWLLAIQFPDREQPSLYPIEGGFGRRPTGTMRLAPRPSSESLQ